MDTNQVSGWKITQNRLADAWRRFRQLSVQAREQGFNVTLCDGEGVPQHPGAFSVEMTAHVSSTVFGADDLIDAPCDTEEHD